MFKVAEAYGKIRGTKMRIKIYDAFKVPEGIRIPYIGGKIYYYLSKKECEYIRKLTISELGLNKEKRKEKIIVSLTSFPSRIEVVGYVLKSLFNQTMKPDRIILWLADDQFPDRQIPKLLNDLCEKGLEIKYCKDLKSHKKYFYALQEQKENELVITYDDDIIYPENSIERLYEKHLKFPKCIVCNRAMEAFMENKKFIPYTNWKVYSGEGVGQPSMRLFPSTGGGTLYPYGSVSKEAFNIEHMKQCAFSADDLWMRFMSALNGTAIIKTRKGHKTFSVLEESQRESLQVENCLNHGNDLALERLCEKYPEAVKNMFG